MARRAAQEERAEAFEYVPANAGPSGWVEYMLLGFSMENLPTVTEGPIGVSYGGKLFWRRMFHGTKMESVYAVVSDWEEQEGGFQLSY